MDYKYMNNNRMWESNVPVGSVVHLTIDNCDGSTGLVIENKNNMSYRVYRIEHDDYTEVYPFELNVIWRPDEQEEK